MSHARVTFHNLNELRIQSGDVLISTQQFECYAKYSFGIGAIFFVVNTVADEYGRLTINLLHEDKFIPWLHHWADIRYFMKHVENVNV